MIKIESDNNIAVVSMDEYNKGVKAIKAIEDLAKLPNRGFEFVYIDSWLDDREYDSLKGCWKGVNVAIIPDEQKKAIKNQMQLEFDIRNEKRLLDLRAKEQAFSAKLKKAKNIKWYHLLFGWKVLKF